MKIKSETITVTWRAFEPGDLVVPSSPRSVLEQGKVYKVSYFLDPCLPYDTLGVVFVEGHKYGLNPEYLKLVEE